ncbi:MAG: hypothetical protein FWE19_08890 [Oscillospiraceae bacterium]|nr:hypothetical protein [Oscillospiraceae bacterium]
MKLSRKLCLTLLLVIVLALSACVSSSPAPAGNAAPPAVEQTEDNNGQDEQDDEQEQEENNAPSNAGILQEIADEANEEMGAMFAAMGDLPISINVEARGENTLAFVMVAEDEEVEDPEVIQLVMTMLSSIFPMLLDGLEYEGIENPRMVAEFFGVDGTLIDSIES